MKRSNSLTAILACLVLVAFACKKNEEAPSLQETEIVGTWEVVGFGRTDGKTGFIGQIFDEECRRIVFTSDKKVLIENISDSSACYSGTWEIIDHEGKNLKVAGLDKTVEWRVWTVTSHQIAIKEADINYNLLQR